MKSISVTILLGLAVTAASPPSFADSHRKKEHANLRPNSGMQVIVNDATVGQPGHRWQYFADRREGRAVVISPNGDYFYGDGDGLTLVHQGALKRRVVHSEPPNV